MKLNEVHTGETTVVKTVGGSGLLRQHLLDMGIIPGEEVKLIGRAPLGDPLEILVQGYTLTLRAAEAELIEVEPWKKQDHKESEEHINFGYNITLHEHNSHPGFGEEGKYHNHSDEQNALPKDAKLTFALVGQQNSGKTTLYNRLTGTNEHVGNFPGQTLDRKESPMKGVPNTVVTDLPGIYSLSPYSDEEILTRKYLEEDTPSGIINIVDTNNIGRGLYLTLQLRELGIPMVLALNMMDEVRNNGGSVRVNEMERILGIPVVPISASGNEGIEELVQHAVHLARYRETPVGGELCESTPEGRYAFIRELCAETVIKPVESKEFQRSRKIDKVLTGRWTAIGIFVLLMALILWLTIDVIGSPLQNMLAKWIGALGERVDGWMSASQVSLPLRSLVVDAIFGGVGTVVSFVPIIIVLFFFLSLLEDSGYMARVAFVTDKLLRKLGLSGRSIVPLLIGLGCSVPAVMATRTLPSARDRKMTVLLIPFMSCSAKIPVYAFFSAAFFPGYGGLVLACLYLLDVLMGVIVALVSKHTYDHGGAAPFIMEMPNYRLPKLKNLGHLLWDKTKDFLRNAFTVIFLATLVIWVLRTFDWNFNMVENGQGSMLAWIGDFFAPLFKPLGLGDWRIVTAFITGFLAKESVVATIGMLGISSIFTVATAVSMLVFSLLYTPCIATIAAVKRELGIGWALFMIVFQCVVAWVVTFIAYNLTLLII